MTRWALAALAAALVAVAAVVWFGHPGDPIEVVIPPGLSAAQTSALLEERGVVRVGFVFRVAAKVSGLDRKLKPGTYPMRQGMSVSAALSVLAAGRNMDVKVAIPEGFSAKQIAERLEAAGVCSAAEFSAYVETQKLEGYLFPTTYFFAPSSGAEKVARRMRSEFDRQIMPLLEAPGPKPKLTPHQILTVASIVQREAVFPQEMPMIAAVYYNRMRKRMRLEADPTVQYALGYWKKRLVFKDLEHPSPYNTYAHFGLPPGPICSPGVEAVKAALAPATTEAVFFVADTTGGHVFSATMEEHLKAKQDFKRKQGAINRGIRELERREKASQPPR